MRGSTTKLACAIPDSTYYIPSREGDEYFFSSGTDMPVLRGTCGDRVRCGGGYFAVGLVVMWFFFGGGVLGAVRRD